MDELREERGHTRVYDDALNNPKHPKLIQNPFGLVLFLVKDAYRGTGSTRYSPKVKALYESGLLCAENSLGYLATKLQTSVPSIQRWLDSLKEWGLVVTHHDASTGEIGIYEVGYWERIRRRSGEFEKVNLYYVNESVQGGLHESVQPPLHESMQPPLNESMLHATNATTTDATPPDATTTTRAAPSASPKPNLQSLLRELPDSPHDEGLGSSLTAQKKKEQAEKAKAEKPPKSTNPGFDPNVRILMEHWEAKYKAVMGVEYKRHPGDQKQIKGQLKDVNINEFIEAIDLYLDNYHQLEAHSGDPAILRMLNGYRWQKLVTAVRSGSKSGLGIVVGACDRPGPSKSETRKVIMEEW